MKLQLNILKDLINDSYIDGKNVHGQCPYCGGNEFGISIDDGHLWGCFRKKKCGESGNIFKLLKHIGKTDLLSKPLINIREKLENSLNKPQQETNPLDLTLPTVTPPVGFKRIYSNIYLEGRGFNQYEKYKIGVTSLNRKLNKYIVCLIEQFGEIKGYIARYVGDSNDKHTPKYRNSVTDFSKLLFGYDDVNDKDTVILVEGVFDKWNIDKFIASKNKVKCCSTFGARVSKYQIELLHRKSVNNIVILYDPDVIEITKKYVAQLYSEFDKVRVGFVKENKDAGEINKEEFDETMLSLYNPISFYASKIGSVLY